MLKGVYSLYDEASQSFNVPFYTVHEQEAIRHIGALLLDKNSMVSNFPQDFKLYKLGTFDTSSGVITSLDVPLLVTAASGINL